MRRKATVDKAHEYRRIGVGYASIAIIDGGGRDRAIQILKNRVGTLAPF